MTFEGDEFAAIVSSAAANKHRIKLAVDAVAGQDDRANVAADDYKAKVTAQRPALCLSAYDAQPPLLAEHELTQLTQLFRRHPLTETNITETRVSKHETGHQHGRLKSARRRTRTKSMGMGMMSSSVESLSFRSSEHGAPGFFVHPITRFRTAARVVMQLRSMGMLEKLESGALKDKNLMDTAQMSGHKEEHPRGPTKHTMLMRSREGAEAILRILEAQCLIDEMPSDMAIDLCRCIELIECPQATTLFKEGGRAESLYIVLKGHVTLHHIDADATFQRNREVLEERAHRLAADSGSVREITRPNRSAEVQAEVEHGPCILCLGAPWAFNEWPMMRGSANSFTAVAHPGASLLRVTAKSFWHVLAHHKSFIPLVSEVVSLVQIPPRERTPPQMMLLSDLIRRHRMFERMDPGKVDELVRYIQCVAYDDNELLFFEGQVQQELLLIMKGNVAVFSNHGVLAGRQLRERVVAAGEVKYEEIADANTAPVPKLDPGTMRSLGMSFSHGMSSSSQGGSLGAALESARAQIHRESSEGSRSVSASPEPARRLAQQPPARHSSRSLIGPRPSESPTLLQRRSIDGADGRRPLVHRVEVRRASESFTSPTSGAELGHPTVAEGRARPPDAPGPSAGVVPRGAEDGAATESARGGSEGEMEMEMGSPQAHARSPMPRGDADSPESAVSRGTTPVPTAVLADGEMLVLAKEDDTAEAHVELVPIAEGDEDADAARSGALEGGLSSVSGGLGSSFAAASPRSAIHRAGSGQGYVITLAAGRQQGVPRGGGFNTRPPGLARAGPGKASPETVARASEVPVGRSPRGGKARGTGLEALAQPRMPKARVTRRDVPKRIETGDRRGSPERGASAAESTASVAHDRAMPVDGAGRQQARRRSLQGYAHNVHGHHGRSRLGQGVRPALGGVAVEDRLDGPLAEVPEDEWEEVGPGRSKTMRERLFLGHDKWEECLGTPLDQAAAFDVLGQGGLLKAGEARSATAVAINKTLALVVRRRHFLPLFVRERHRMVHVADLLQLLEVPLAQRTAKTAKQISYILQSNGVLEQFDPRIRVDLCQSMRLVSRESGEHLYRQGDVADSFYVVLQGMVSVHVKPHTADYSEKYSSDIIGRFGPVTSIVTERGILGDVGASRGAVRHNTVVAHEPTKLAAVSMSSFKVLMQKVEAEERLSQAHYLRKIPGMQDWDPVRLSQVSEMFVLERYKRGQVVLQQGAPADAFTIIKRGQVQVRCRLLTTSRQQLQQRPQKAKDVPPHLKNLDVESVDEQLRAMDGAEELLPKDMASKAPRWLDLGVLGPGQFIGDIPIILGVNSPFQIEAITDCHLHVAHPEDMLEALVSDDKALEAMRASSLSKLAFFVERKREVLQTFVKVSTHIMQEKTLLLEPLIIPAPSAGSKGRRSPQRLAGENTAPQLGLPEWSHIDSISDPRSLGTFQKDASVAFLGGEESLGMWDSELSLPMVPSPLKGEASAANVGVPRPRAEAHEHEEGLPAVRGARGPGDGSRGEVRQGGGGHKGGRGVVDWSTLKLSKPLSSVGKSTAAMLERSLQAMNVKGSRSKHGGPRTVAVDGAVVSEMMTMVQEVSKLSQATASPRRR